MDRVGGMNRVAMGSGRCKCGRDLLADQSGLAHTGHDHISTARHEPFDRVAEFVTQTSRQLQERMAFVPNDVATWPQEHRCAIARYGGGRVCAVGIGRAAIRYGYDQLDWILGTHKRTASSVCTRSLEAYIRTTLVGCSASAPELVSTLEV